MNVTQKQIAEKLNVSSSLVGRALRGDLAVAQSTRERIAAAALEMGYDANTNRGARFLAARRYGNRLRNDGIAVLYLAGGQHSLRALPLYSALLEGIEAEALEQEVEISLCPAATASLPRLVGERNVDGVILLEHSPAQLAQLRAAALPASTLFEHRAGFAGLAVDDREGTYQTTRHLLELGHRRIAYLGVRESPEEPAAGLRLQGYLDALAESEVAAPTEWRETALRLPSTTPTSYCAGCRVCAACVGWQSLTRTMGPPGKKRDLPFTALVCHNDAIAMGAIESAQREGLKVPADLSVTGFDDLSAAYHFRLAITSAQFSPQEMGRNAFRILQEAIRNAAEVEENEGGETAAQHYIFPVGLAVRETTLPVEGGALPVEDGVKQQSLF